MKRMLKFLAGVLLAAVLVLAALLALALNAVAPQPGDWSVRLAWWRFEQQASVPTLLRWATHPAVMPHLAGRRLGAWQVEAADAHRLEARCAPCRVQIDAFGPQPLPIDDARLIVDVRGADRFDGTLRLGGDAAPVTLRWRAELKRDGLSLHADMAPTPLARVVAVFGEAVPEARRARIEGSVSLRATATLGAQGLAFVKLRPKLADVSVDGLGTETLRDVDAAARCRPQPAIGRVEGWIQNAVIAAEDARFFEHPGYEMEAWLAVFMANQREGEPLQGASTITQQLAKLLYTGDARDPARKLREWLYAVEMERTLGKGRILQLYLALLPWGDGICGAEAAARHHLGKSANQLRPREAAWLASLLVNPDQQLQRWARDEPAARERAAAVLKGIQRLPRERREAELDALVSWRPPIGMQAR